MGIRKHFEQQKEQEDLKLSEIGFEVTESKQPHFDPERDITESDWQSLLEILERYTMYTSADVGYEFAKLASAMKVIDSQKEIIIDREAWERLMKKVPVTISALAVNMKILDPERFNKSDLQDPSFQKDMQELEGQRTPHTSWRLFAVKAVNIMILWPEKASELNIGQVEWQGMHAKLEEYRQKKEWKKFAIQAKNMKILDPKEFEGVRISKLDWEEMLNQLNQFRRDGFRRDSIGTDGWHHFAELASALTILAAGKVEVTDNGLEISMQKAEDFKQQKKPRPERRAF